MKGVTPIIAHPERYKLVQNSIDIVYDWINAGCIIQIDAGSVIGMLGKMAKKTSRLLIEEGVLPYFIIRCAQRFQQEFLY